MKALLFILFLISQIGLVFSQTSIIEYDNLNQFKKVSILNGNSITYQYDEVGNRLAKILTNNPSTDLSLLNLQVGFKLYPNPTSESFCISGFEDNATLKLTDISGKVILTKQVLDNEIITISLLPKGIYIVELITKKGIVEKKLLKK
jgi:hypothetical protein